MEGMGQNPKDAYFYEPWRGRSGISGGRCGGFGILVPSLYSGKKDSDTYEMITYSIPLRYEGQVYGVLGVEISCQNLYDYFPAGELNSSQQSGYIAGCEKGGWKLPAF